MLRSKTIHVINTPLARRFFVLAADRGVQLLSQLFTIFILANYLGAGPFGILLYALSVYGFLLTLSNVGMERVLVIELSRGGEKEKEGELVVAGFFIKLLMGLLLLCMLLLGKNVFMGFMSEQVYGVMILLSFSLPFSSWIVADAYNQSRENFRFTAFARISATILCLVARAVMVMMNASFTAIVISFVVEQAICLLIMLCISKGIYGAFRQVRLRYLLGRSAEVMRAGLLVMASTACIIIYFRVSQGIIEQRFDKSVLGVYSLVIYLIEVPISLASVMSTIFTPALTKELAEPGIATVFPARVLKLFIIVSLLSIVAILCTGLVLHLFLGNSYKGFLFMLLKAMICMPVLFAGYFFNIYLLCSKLFKRYLLVTFAGAGSALLFIWMVHGVVTESTAVFLYVGTQVLASVITPLLFSRSLRNITWQVISSFDFRSPVNDLRPLFYPKY